MRQRSVAEIVALNYMDKWKQVNGAKVDLAIKQVVSDCLYAPEMLFRSFCLGNLGCYMQRIQEDFQLRHDHFDLRPYGEGMPHMATLKGRKPLPGGMYENGDVLFGDDHLVKSILVPTDDGTYALTLEDCAVMVGYGSCLDEDNSLQKSEALPLEWLREYAESIDPKHERLKKACSVVLSQWRSDCSRKG